MNPTEVLKQTELFIAGLSVVDKKRLLKRLSSDLGVAAHGIEVSAKVMGGAACIRNTRIPVWLLIRARQLGFSEGDLLKSYPGLTAEDLVNAWDYARSNPDEIEMHIRANESDD